MKIELKTKSLVFTEDDYEMRVQYGNRGDPFREGVEFCFKGPESAIWV